MECKAFSEVAAKEDSPNWEQYVHREKELYKQSEEFRNAFERDYTRILHSLGYRRLKHKTQVFFNTHNDHVCTRIEHVNHVDSVSYTIANHLGLNVSLTKAIATGHDIGHSPFGHQGEKVIKNLVADNLEENFFHEKNSLHFIDDVELLEDSHRCLRNLCLTYAVRDGIISHCGEIDENYLSPRKNAIDLALFNSPGEYEPYTWEACVVKISDKISYLGRDIEDALRLKFIGMKEYRVLVGLAKEFGMDAINNTSMINVSINNLCQNSSPDKGLRFSSEALSLINRIKKFNYENIYLNSRFDIYMRYVELIIQSIYNTLYSWYNGEYTLECILSKKEAFPKLAAGFADNLALYCDRSIVPSEMSLPKCDNTKIYGKLEKKSEYIWAVIDYITGMTDQFAIEIFNELTSF